MTLPSPLLTVARALLAAALLAVALPPAALGASDAQKKADVEKMAQDTLNRLYAAQPAAKKAVRSAAGYAVFSAFGAKIFVAGGGSGGGLAVYNATDKKVYMKMAEVQAGLGMGVKKSLRVRGVALHGRVGDNDDLRWVARDELPSLGIPAPIRKLLEGTS